MNGSRSTLEWFTQELADCRLSRSRLLSVIETQEMVLTIEEQAYLADFRALVLDAALALTAAIDACESATTHDGAVVAHQAVYRAQVAVAAVDALESDVAHRTALLACKRVST